MRRDVRTLRKSNTARKPPNSNAKKFRKAPEIATREDGHDHRFDLLSICPNAEEIIYEDQDPCHGAA